MMKIKREINVYRAFSSHTGKKKMLKHITRGMLYKLTPIKWVATPQKVVLVSEEWPEQSFKEVIDMLPDTLFFKMEGSEITKNMINVIKYLNQKGKVTSIKTENVPKSILNDLFSTNINKLKYLLPKISNFKKFRNTEKYKKIKNELQAINGYNKESKIKVSVISILDRKALPDLKMMIKEFHHIPVEKIVFYFDKKLNRREKNYLLWVKRTIASKVSTIISISFLPAYLLPTNRLWKGYFIDADGNCFETKKDLLEKVNIVKKIKKG